MNPIVRLIPPFLVRTFARRYVAGDSLPTALDTATHLLEERKLLSTLDLLAEDIRDAATARRNLDTYLELVDAVADRPAFADLSTRPSVSLKLSSYTTAPLDRGGNAAGSREAAFAIVERARDRNVAITVDMESHHWTDFTLKLVEDLHQAGHDHVGTVVQTRLHRTDEDLARLPAGCRVRLVIGIYNEPEEIALTDKRAMKEKMLDSARILLERGHYVEFATHDELFVRRFVDEIAPAAGAGTDRFEIQLLYGVPRDSLLAELADKGVTARLYVPFALGWPMAIAYLRRRLDEHPNMAFLVAKNLFAGS